MDPYGKEAESVDVGKRLRILREERGISMRALARRSGLSANALSMIERGLTSPSVSTLNKLATALEVPITAFFRQEPAREQIVHRKSSERTRIPFLRGMIEGLGGENFVGRVEAFLLTLESGGSSGPHGMIHTGQEMVFCLRGVIEYEVEEKRFVLEPGDSLIFVAQLVHRWRNLGDHVANAIIVISSFEESERPGEYHLASMVANSSRQTELTEDGSDGVAGLKASEGGANLSEEV
ncbi:MAG: helix-turn-helix domain-containing protein [Anaerolineaceae bacterium]|nr:helix-turn-helix domain-containing protein [Anaerolineaceae bacterium]